VIEEISIRDLGVIAAASLPLGAGFTALTGETGAGKTMVVSALGLLLGERADAGAVRAGSAQALVEGRWNVPLEGEVATRVHDAGGDLDEADPLPKSSDGARVRRGELVLARTVTSEGRSRAIVGGRSAPVAVLSELGEQLVVVHGQSDQVRLRSAVAQREALDRFAGEDLVQVLTDYQHVFHRWRENRTELAELVDDRDRRAREADELRESLAEIETVAPQPGEDAELAERAERLTNQEDLRIAAIGARELVSAEESDEPDALTLLDSARRLLERVSGHDAQLAAIAEAVANANYAVADVAAQLSSYLAELDADDARELEIVQERRAELAALTRKYGPTTEDVLALLESGSTRLLELDSDSERIEQLASDVAADEETVRSLADALSALRRTAAERLATEVSDELGALAMADARLVVEISERDEFSQFGVDQVSILLQPHNGAEPRPLGRGASGGELSRVMLAIEVVIAAADPVPTFVFDEVDAGVGGASAIEIGKRLARLAEKSQVIVVTHLAQVAAFATNHLSVVKGSDGSVTASSVRQLTGEERTAEMARLLSGLPDSESGLAHARELVEMASSVRRNSR
jgi:DNA repair protein RecN (Recombination protein N)